jgi:predicted amidohydrolase
MQKIRVAGISMNGLLGQTRENLNRIEQWSEKAKKEGAELVLFPELVVHGHCDPNTWYNAESVPEGPSTQRLCQLAARLRLVLCVGLSEKEDDIVYNTQVLAGPAGYLGMQRKIHLSRDEVIYYEGGTEMPVFDVGKCRVGIVICYDNSFPEPARILALQGAEVLLMPHAARMKTWSDTAESEKEAVAYTHRFYKTMYPTRAYENACYAVVCDQAGRAGYVDVYPKDSPNQPHHAGGCLVIDPLGEIAAETQCERIQEDMLVADLLPEKLWEARSKPNYTIRQRRPELFSRLSA